MKKKNSCTKADDGQQGNLFSHLATCTNITEFKENILFAVRQLGFTDFSFFVLRTPPGKSLTTLPDKVREFYLKDDFVNCDLLLEHAAGSNSPVFLSTLEGFIAQAPFASERIQRNANYYKLLGSLGYCDGYCVPQGFGRDARRAMFIFFAKDLSREDFHRQVEQFKTLLPMIASAAVYFGFTNFPEHFLDVKFSGPLALTPKPLKMLETLAKEGLLLKEAAAKLRISMDTANKHVAAAKKALGVTTLSNAVYLAMVHGLLADEEEENERQS